MFDVIPSHYIERCKTNWCSIMFIEIMTVVYIGTETVLSPHREEIVEWSICIESGRYYICAGYWLQTVLEIRIKRRPRNYFEIIIGSLTKHFIECNGQLLNLISLFSSVFALFVRPVTLYRIFSFGNRFKFLFITSHQRKFIFHYYFNIVEKWSRKKKIWINFNCCKKWPAKKYRFLDPQWSQKRNRKRKAYVQLK